MPLDKIKRKALYTQTHGRRASDKPEEAKWKFDWWKLIFIPILGWATWVTMHGFLAERNSERLNKQQGDATVQYGVLHNRITDLSVTHTHDDQGIRIWILDKLLELQREIYTHERVDLTEGEEGSGLRDNNP